MPCPRGPTCEKMFQFCRNFLTTPKSGVKFWNQNVHGQGLWMHSLVSQICCLRLKNWLTGLQRPLTVDTISIRHTGPSLPAFRPFHGLRKGRYISREEKEPHKCLPEAEQELTMAKISFLFRVHNKCCDANTRQLMRKCFWLFRSG